MKTQNQILELSPIEFSEFILDNDISYVVLEEYATLIAGNGKEALEELLALTRNSLNLHPLDGYMHQDNVLRLRQILEDKIKAYKHPKKEKDTNRPELTQDQLTLLFALLRSKKLIHSSTTDKALSECIKELGRYQSSESIRQSLSQRIGDIEKKSNDLELVINKLEGVIEKLKELKSIADNQ